ncbi:MAG TPA: RNB domain-containing ribonuclease [Microthrixaceae bacterium]|nr:RNB domain-containing ribonuclease [Microthrixaceae bacterium]
MRSPRRHAVVELEPVFAAIRRRHEVQVEFSPEVRDAAAAAAARGAAAGARADRREVDLVSIDPAGSRDIDQALALERRKGGYRFWYAIADLAAWVESGDPVDLEARRRGTTVYCPDARAPLHPVELSEGAASLLEGAERPAVLWRIDLDDRGAVADVAVERALVRNRRAMSYVDAQHEIDAGTATGALALLREIGEARLALERERGGVSLNLPEQNVVRVDGHYVLRYDAGLPVESWNAQLSLCCGMAAAELMLSAGVGVLRTLPKADARSLDLLRQHSLALGVAWPAGLSYPEWVRSLDVSTPAGAALTTQAARTLRGASYVAFDGAPPADHAHSAIAAPYAHVTAPIRRLVDRFANECVLAAAAGIRPPGWALDALPSVAGWMDAAARRSSAVDREMIDVTEAAVLAHRLGEEFPAVVTNSGRGSSTIQLAEPAVIASVAVELAPGTTCRVRLDSVDIAVPRTQFSVVSTAP